MTLADPSTPFAGAYTALVTPFTASGDAVDLDRLEEHVRFQADAGITGVVPCGTTGETPTLSDDEYRAVVERTVAVAGTTNLTVIAGAGSNCTRHALELHRFVAESGADASLQVAPYYNRPTQEGLYRHFMTLADAVDLPIVVYNIPGRTGVLITAETLERVAAHPNIVAVKDATGGLEIAQIIADRTDLTLLSGDDPLTLPLAIIGGAGIISVIGNLLPERVAALTRACLEQDWATAHEVHAVIAPIAKALLELDSNPVPVKTAMRLLGRDSGAVRLPLCPTTDDVVAQIRALVGNGAEAIVG